MPHLTTDTGDPFTASELDAALSRLGVAVSAGLAVAVSGGADSMALVHLAARCRPVVALTVDHGLRPASASEAAFVARLLGQAGIAHHRLAWQGVKPATGVQAAARAARYGLMAAWCRDNGIDTLATAHHREDQAETVLLRLARGSGLTGLAAMRGRTLVPGCRETALVRPLLDQPKSRLTAFLKAENIDWIEDPSNEDPSYTRVQARRLLKAPPLEGLTPARLADTARRLARARDALDHYVDQWGRQYIVCAAEGFASLDRAGLALAPDEVILRALAATVKWVSGKGMGTQGGAGGVYGPRGDRLEDLLLALRDPAFRGATLAGTRFLIRRGSLFIVRELAAMPSTTLTPGQTLLYDGRFRVHMPDVMPSSSAFVAAPLGTAGWNSLPAPSVAVCRDKLPHDVAVVLPAVFSGDRLVSIPHWPDLIPGSVSAPAIRIAPAGPPPFSGA
ncbi:tRNA lysidine(34) synthetase TilS [Eilatimonas milleporae]|uniref:tRNA(Ile)-lysidine synthase n=1 Tax=Eilatimonas milleporae TaxID=911205 RepID=A0A3M0CQT4_9PROT|nr:tRNA lysidine(34) synthetase TilS [Eilatimonas milleporae]RMB11862.1 tRNA(Ile)-lysidine synthase [Eilatimonas milleporae]